MSSVTSSSIGTLSLPSEGPKTGIAVMLVSHAKMTKLFKELLMNNTYEEKMKIKSDLITVVTKHILTEEQVIYPTVKAISPDSKEDVNRSVERETVLKQNLMRIETMSPDDSNFEFFVRETNYSLQQHIKHEEKNLFPVLEKKLGKDELSCMADLIMTLYEIAPSRPNPSASSHQKPMTEVAAGPLTIYFDKIRNLASKLKTTTSR